MHLKQIKVQRAYRFEARSPDNTAVAIAEVETIGGGVRVEINNGSWAADSDLTTPGAVALYHALRAWYEANWGDK